MRILSLYFGHDANLTLLEDGVPVVLLEKERLTRIKHDQGLMDLDAILAAYGWSPDSIDMLAINPATRPALDGREFQWEVEGGRYDHRPDYKLDGWSGPPEGRMSRHRIRMFGRSISCLPAVARAGYARALARPGRRGYAAEAGVVSWTRRSRWSCRSCCTCSRTRSEP